MRKRLKRTLTPLVREIVKEEKLQPIQIWIDIEQLIGEVQVTSRAEGECTDLRLLPEQLERLFRENFQEVLSQILKHCKQ